MRKAFEKAQISKPKSFDVNRVPSIPHMSKMRMLTFIPLMSATASYLEYGAGGSTSMAHLLSVPQITSVEANEQFVTSLRAKFPNSGTTIIHADLGTIGDWGNPVDTAPTLENRKRWNNYASCAWDFYEENNQEMPEFVLIDGAIRDLCILTSFMRLPDNAYTTFFLDDSQYVDCESLEPFMTDKVLIEDIKQDDRGRRVKQALLFRKNPAMDRYACQSAIESFTP